MTVAMMALIQDCPYLRGTRLFRTLTTQGPEGLGAAFSETRWIDHVWGDALRIAGVLGIMDGARALSRCETTTAVQRLHDRWARQLNVRLSEHHGRQALREARFARKREPPWPSPPIPGNADVEPILGWEELIAEGRLMEHCVASYSAAVQSGKSYIYRVLRPERATLELQGRGDTLRIAQIRLSRNHAPAPETLQAIDAWFSAFRGPGAAEQPQRPQ